MIEWVQFSVPALLFTTALLSADARPYAELPLSELEQRRRSIEDELKVTAPFSLRSGVGAIGYRTESQDSPDSDQWIQIEWTHNRPIDEVVLVPTIWRDPYERIQNDGFPAEFHVLAGTSDDDLGTVLFSQSASSPPVLPRIAPLVIPCQAVTASWIRLVVTRLSPRAHDGRHSLQLSEILVFSGHENVALRAKVHTATEVPKPTKAWHSSFLVDGFVPYLMNGPHGERSLPMIGHVPPDKPATLTVDLQESMPISAIHLHLIDQSDTVPQSTPGDFGLPRRILIEGANQPNFSDAAILADFRWQSMYEIGPILMFPFEERQYRWVRITTFDPHISIYEDVQISRIGFAEIEALTAGQNVAKGKPVALSFSTENTPDKPEHLTDGRNLFGDILPIRDWMDQLARRHDLEAAYPQVLAELGLRYTAQQARLHWLSWLAAALGVGVVTTLLISRNVRLRRESQLRERFSADLHDELGASLHTIALLGDVAASSAAAPDRMNLALQRIRQVTDSLSTAVRHCANLQQLHGQVGTLKKDLERIANRIMADGHYQITVENEVALSTLNPATRTDLYLFYKECLVNISRHSGATEFTTHLRADRRHLELEVTDNGCGLADLPDGKAPASLERRARLMGATLYIQSLEAGGTQIHLTLRRGWPGFRKWQCP